MGWGLVEGATSQVLYSCNVWNIASAISTYPHAWDITLSPHTATQVLAA